MIRGLTDSASGMLVNQRMQDMLANNLANAQTPGFKAAQGSTLSFPEQLIRQMNYTTQDYGAGTPMGMMGTGVVFQEGVPNFTQGAVQNTGRNLDVAVVDNSLPGTLTKVLAGNNQTRVTNSPIAATGPQGRLQAGGSPVAVLNSTGQPVAGVYAVKNPAYTGQAFTAADGRPDYDANGQPSYLYANAQGTVIGSPANQDYSTWGLQVGTSASMGPHSFFPVAYTSSQGQTGIVLTRDGSFQVNGQQQLVDSAGNPILPVGANGRPIPQGRIVMNPNYQGGALFNTDGSAVIDKNGQPSYRVVNQNGTPIPGRLGLVDADITQLKPLGATEYQVGNSLTANTVLTQLGVGTASIVPQALEASNVDATTDMTQMLQTVNQYQANSQMIQIQDTELAKAVDDVGKVNL